MLDRSRCIIIVPIYQHVESRCDQALRGLERAGYRVWRRHGGAAIDIARNRMATAALEEGYSELMWIDADIEFPVDAVDALRDLDLPLVGVPYPKKGEPQFAFHGGDTMLTMGEGGELVEVTYLPTGFLHTRREVYETMIERLKLPLCNRIFGDTPFYPFFQPFIVPYKDQHWYLGEDYAFCERAKQCGYKMVMDPRIRLWHLGAYGYTWEDGCGERPRYQTFHVDLRAGTQSATASAPAAPGEATSTSTSVPAPGGAKP